MRFLLGLTLAAMILSACARTGCADTAAMQAKDDSVQGNMMLTDRTRVPRLMNLATQEAALDEVRAAVRSGMLTDGDAEELIRLAPSLPDDPQQRSYGIAERLLRTLNRMRPAPTWLPRIEESYRALAPGARAEALQLLTRAESEEGVHAFLRLARIEEGQPESLPMEALLETTPHADALFPALFDLATERRWRADIYLAALAYAEAGKLPAAVAAARVEQLRAHYAEARATLDQHPAAPGIGWRFEGTYAGARREAGILLDLMGHLPPALFVDELQAATGAPDPHVQFCAASALLRQGKHVPPHVLEQIAASAEMRGALLELLVRLERAELFPARFVTQAALAESEMVLWLSFPSELGRPPDEMELMEVVSYESAEIGTVDYFVFRFRTIGEHWAAKDGWMAAWSGPYLRQKQLQLNGPDTFSRFEAAGSKTAREHVGSDADVKERLARIGLN